MDRKPFPDVASFLIRFVQDQPIPDKTASYRGVIRHIQTENEIFFTCWKEVETFIQQVIPLEIIKTDKGEDHEIEG